MLGLNAMDWRVNVNTHGCASIDRNMNITFKTKKLQKLFNQKKELIRKYGEHRAKVMQLRMIQIQAAQSLADLGPPYSGPARCHERWYFFSRLRTSLSLIILSKS